ncbi:hypothetical protein HDU81_010738 [Chytriomyces hyalinus]|nr:hypothetical protein HDU81_010738 [Chytriomyces hyalinus]
MVRVLRKGKEAKQMNQQELYDAYAQRSSLLYIGTAANDALIKFGIVHPPLTLHDHFQMHAVEALEAVWLLKDEHLDAAETEFLAHPAICGNSVKMDPAPNTNVMLVMPERTVVHLIVIATQIFQRINMEEDLPHQHRAEDGSTHKRDLQTLQQETLELEAQNRLREATIREQELDLRSKRLKFDHTSRQQKLLVERAQSLRTFIETEIRKGDEDDAILRETAMQMYHVFYAVPYAVTPEFMDEAFATLGFHVSPNDGMYFGAVWRRKVC